MQVTFSEWQDQMTQYYKTRREIVLEGDDGDRETVQYWDGGVRDMDGW